MSKAPQDKQAAHITQAVKNKMTQDSKVHFNIEQDLIFTTEDKLRLCLIEYLDSISKKGKWTTPFGMLITVGLTLLTADFKEFILTKEQWQAIFIFSIFLLISWLAKRVYNSYNSKKTLEDLVVSIKKKSNEMNNGADNIKQFP